MRSNKFMRTMDKLGRMVIPREIRNDLKIKQDDRIEFFIEGENLILKKYSPHQTCFITGEKLATNS
ncbi:MAG: AbrB/MazE/SpoVT family DNA-binding domain-containing protein, partial [Melioribacteraceae bacterium]|nr:AbrB/MazE/SpoVT family DNA-binding domain-containing protein [Melioribacteraceae bacterium]